MNIKAIFFDLDGVIVNRGSALPAIAEYFGIDQDTLSTSYIPLLRQHERGLIDQKTFWKELAKSLKSDVVTPIDGPFNLPFSKRIDINEKMLQLIKKLKMNGYFIGLISNNVAGYTDYIRQSHILDDFELQVFSFETHLCKPEKGIYEYALNQADISGGNALFIDDNADNVKGAQDVGMQAIQFIDYAKLKEILERLDILTVQDLQ